MKGDCHKWIAFRDYCPDCGAHICSECHTWAQAGEECQNCGKDNKKKEYKTIDEIDAAVKSGEISIDELNVWLTKVAGWRFKQQKGKDYER